MIFHKLDGPESLIMGYKRRQNTSCCWCGVQIGVDAKSTLRKLVFCVYRSENREARMDGLYLFGFR